MAKTAIQELIYELKQFAKFPLLDKATVEAAIDFAKIAQEKEKQQLIDFAYSQLGNVEAKGNDIVYKKLPEELYKDKFEY